jgi:hypothetical protein
MRSTNHSKVKEENNALAYHTALLAPQPKGGGSPEVQIHFYMLPKKLDSSMIHILHIILIMGILLMIYSSAMLRTPHMRAEIFRYVDTYGDWLK